MASGDGITMQRRMSAIVRYLGSTTSFHESTYSLIKSIILSSALTKGKLSTSGNLLDSVSSSIKWSLKRGSSTGTLASRVMKSW